MEQPGLKPAHTSQVKALPAVPQNQHHFDHFYISKDQFISGHCHLKPQLALLASHISPGSSPGFTLHPTLCQCVQEGDAHGMAASWPQPCPALAVVFIWKVN